MIFRFRSPASAVAPAPLRERIDCVLADGRRVEVLRVRDARARRLKLSVSERGVRLTLPLRASDAVAERFLHEHRDWLAAQLDQLDDHDAQPLCVGETSTLPLRDAALPVVWSEGRFARIARIDDALHCQAPARDGARALRRALRDFYEAEARADIGRWLPQYLPGLPRAPRRVQLKVMSSQWGSLAPDGTVALDLSLVLGAPAAFEYVLVHELCHLIHHDHSAAFWREVSARCPAWQVQRDYFKRDGRRLKAQLKTLIG